VAFYILLIAVMNLGLGYAVAVHLGRRYRALLAAELGGELIEPLAPGKAGLVDFDRETVESSPAGVAELDKATQESVALVGQLLQETADYRALLDEADRFSKSDHQQVDSGECGDLLGRLSEGTEAYIDHRQARESGFRALIEHDVLDCQRESLASAWDQQDAQLRQVSDATERLSAEPDSEEFWAEFGKQVTDLLATTSDVDSMLGEAKTSLDDVAEPPESADAPSQPAAPAESLGERWAADAEDPDACPSIALVDVDHVDRMNEQFGRTLVDRMLEAIFHEVESTRRDGALIHRMDNQRFTLLFSNPDVQRTANIIERIRQKVGKAHFVGGDEELRATVSCAVGGPLPDDDVDSLLARVQATLGDAKKRGRDRTFLHRGDSAAPVVPPTLTLEETTTRLDVDQSSAAPSIGADQGD